MKNENDIHGFNVACQKNVTKSMQFFMKTCLALDTSKYACFWYQIYRGIDMDNTTLTSLPSPSTQELEFIIAKHYTII